MDLLVLKYTMPHHLRGRGWKYKKLEVEELEVSGISEGEGLEI